MARIRVIIADDHDVVREGLRLLIQADPRIEVAGEARTGSDAVQLTMKLNPDVVLMDVLMAGMSGAEAARQITRVRPRSRVLMLSSFSGDECVRESIEAGAAGYVTKHSASGELLEAIETVRAGGFYFSSTVGRWLRERTSAKALRCGQPHLSTLSARERQVLQLVAQGMPNKQIADVLGISIKTVEKHRQQLIDKLDIHDTAGLTRYAIDNGLVGLQGLARMPTSDGGRPSPQT